MPCRKAGLFLYVFSKKCRRYKSETAYTAYIVMDFFGVVKYKMYKYLIISLKHSIFLIIA